MSLPPFRADQVGSLLRPAALSDTRARWRAGEVDAATLRSAIIENLLELQALGERELCEQRYAKFRRMGRFLDASSPEGARTA